MSAAERPWTVEEAAAWLACSEEHVRRLARAGTIGRKFGRSWRFDPAEVRALIPVRRGAEARPELADVFEARMHAVFARRA